MTTKSKVSMIFVALILLTSYLIFYILFFAHKNEPVEAATSAYSNEVSGYEYVPMYGQLYLTTGDFDCTISIPDPVLWGNGEGAMPYLMFVMEWQYFTIIPSEIYVWNDDVTSFTVEFIGSSNTSSLSSAMSTAINDLNNGTNPSIHTTSVTRSGNTFAFENAINHYAEYYFTPTSGPSNIYLAIAASIEIPDNAYMIVTHSLTFDYASGSGNILSAEGERLEGTADYISNSSIAVSASPSDGYIFDHWVLNGSTRTENPLTFTITQDSTLMVYFRQPVEITSSNNGSEFATFNTETLDLSYRYNITFTTDNYLYSATVNTGAEQRIASMNGMLTVPDNSCTAIIYYTNETGSRLFLEIIGVTGDVTINLTFSNVSQSFSPTSGGGASGIVVSATEGGVASVVGDDFENLADDDEILYIAKLAQNGYQFSHWEDAEGNILGYTDNLLLTKAEAYNTKVIAVFIPTNQENTNSTTDTQPTDTPEII